MIRSALIIRVAVGVVVAVIAAIYFLNSGSKISNADISKLNAAADRLHGTSATLNRGVTRCAGEINLEGCLNKLGRKMAGTLNGAAATYDQVAGDASGKCKTSLNKGAVDLRAIAEQFTSATGTPDPSKMLADQKTIASACNLDLKKIK